MNIKRTMKLIAFMEKLPKSAERHFNMEKWFEHRGSHAYDHDFGRYVTKKTLSHCGTTACALGWASTDPWFKRRGLRAQTASVFLDDWPEFFGCPSREVGQFTDNDGDPVLDNDYLFADWCYPAVWRTTPRQVARRIRKFVAQQSVVIGGRR